MRIRGGSKLYIPNTSEMLTYLKTVLRNSWIEGVIIIKPSVIPVLIRGKIRQVVAPPLSLVTASDALVANYLRGFEVAEDCWVDGKALPNLNNVYVLDSSLTTSLSLPPHPQQVSPACFIIGDKVSIDEYVANYLNYRHIAVLPRMKEAEVREVSGRINYLWSYHPVLYGVKRGIELRVNAIASIPRKVDVLSKPLLHIDNEVMIAELPFNNSIIFTAFDLNNELVTELIMRSLIYVC